MIEEASLQKLLEILIEANIIKRWKFISCGGDKNPPNYVDKIESFTIQDTLIKCNPFYSDKYCIIIDKPADDFKKDKISAGRYAKLKDRMKERLIILNEYSLEEYYKDYNHETYDQYLEEVNKFEANDHANRGKVKFNFAKQIGEKIIESSNGKEEFKKLFKDELNFLLKEDEITI